MSQTSHGDIEDGSDSGDQHQQTQPHTPSNPQPAPNQPLQAESIFGDSSGPLFSMYSKAAEEEDNRMVGRWQKDADGILIFTGLFSAAVAALLAVTVQDLRPNSQDTSAFYLGNIYQVLADPNVTLTSVPTPVTKPPPFSRPKYAVWVNSLWFLSLVMSLSCALWATSLQQWARRYIYLTQPARCSPEKRARKRAFFANGVDKMHVPWAVEGLPTLLHLALFLFFCGLAIFLFNVDQEVFACVVSWIGFFSIVYGLVTLLPIIRHDSPYNTPLSTTARFVYARIRSLYAMIRFSFARIKYLALKALVYCRESYRRYRAPQRIPPRRYRKWLLRMERRMDRLKSVKSVSVEKKAEESAEEPSSEIDLRILGWTISALGDDDSLEKFFEAIPGFFNSKLVKDLERDIPVSLLKTFWRAFDGFMDRTSSSNSVTESVKSRRDVNWGYIMTTIPRPDYDIYTDIRSKISNEASHRRRSYFHFYEAPVAIERLETMSRWITHSSYGSDFARDYVVWHLSRLEEHDKRDDRWIMLAQTAYDVPVKTDMKRENMFLETLIDVSREAKSTPRNFLMLELVGLLAAEFDIRRTHFQSQRDFCTLWKQLVQEAKERQSNTSFSILRLIRHHFITLHQGTDASPTSFSTSTELFDSIWIRPSLYPICDTDGHYPEPWNTPAPIPPTATLSYPREGTTLEDVLTPWAEPDTIEILSTTCAPVPTLTPEPVPESTPRVPNESSTTCDADAASVSNRSNPFPPASSFIGFSPASSPPSRVLPLLNAEFLALLDGTTPPGPTDNAALPHVRARGLVNNGNMCFANAMLQLLVHSPPFWNLVWQLGDLKGRHGGGLEPGGCATALVDATIRFFDEFVFKDKEPPPTQQPLQQPETTNAKATEGEVEKNDNKIMDSFEPTYLYEAMKEKSQLKHMLDGKNEDAEEFIGLYLDALDRELVELKTYISTHEPASVPNVEEFEGEVAEAKSAEGQTEVGKRDYTASSIESPISRIFGGRSRSTVRVPGQDDNVAIEAWRSLKLFIQPDSVHTIQDALALVSQPQPVQVGPSSSSEGSQEVLLEALPPVLVLHLKRFLYDTAADGIVKISKPVQFTPELQIPLQIMVPDAGKSAEPVHYKLYGVLYHHGASASSGHYTVDVLHPNEDSGSGDGWLRVDDEALSTVRQEDVFGGHDNERADDRCAYMLFFCRTAPAWT